MKYRVSSVAFVVGRGWAISPSIFMDRSVPTGIRQCWPTAPSGIALPCLRAHWSLGNPHLMTNEGKNQREKPYWPTGNNSERPWMVRSWGKVGAGSDFELITVRSPLPGPAPTPAFHWGWYLINTPPPNHTPVPVSTEPNLWQCSKLIYMELPNNLFKKVNMLNLICLFHLFDFTSFIMIFASNGYL